MTDLIARLQRGTQGQGHHTMTDDDRWYQHAKDNGWQMPVAPWWKRLLIIRHARALYHKWQIEKWYAVGPGSIGLRTGYDDWIIYGIWAGRESADLAPPEDGT